MNVKVLKQSKNEIEVEANNTTIVEVLRSYLNKQGVEFAAWKRKHPTKPALLKVDSSKNVKKEISDAISAIKSDLNKITNSLKK